MADPMTRAKLSELLGDMECGVGPDSGDIMNACDELVAQARAEERAEVERLTAELATVLKNYERLQGEAITLEGERDEARAEIAEAIEEGRRRAEYVRRVEGERDRARLAWQSARRGRRSARLLNRELVGAMEKLRAERDEARQDGKRTARVLEDAGHDREEQRRRAETAEAELAEAREQVEIERGRGNGYANQIIRVKQARVWTNEDGKEFVFADDLRAALDGTEAGQ